MTRDFALAVTRNLVGKYKMNVSYERRSGGAWAWESRYFRLYYDPATLQSTVELRGIPVPISLLDLDPDEIKAYLSQVIDVVALQQAQEA